jgi:homotetrameric cytidine deaminase
VPVNIELKARDIDPEATLDRCQALGAEDRGSFKQRDTYFAARGGRFKLREQGDGEHELIAYRRPDGVAASESSYVRAPVAASRELAGVLDEALGTVDVVLKRRRLLVWEGVRIHLDDVVGLGSFIEFEAVLPDAGSPDEARAKVARLKSELSITDEMLVPVGYLDLQLDGPIVLLRTAEAAMRNAYVPYSNFPVGAAIRGRSGAIYAAANVENAAYPQGQCAEASAIGAMVAAGETAITAVAVVAERVQRCPPCGGCRQRLAEFGTADTVVYLGRPDTIFDTTSLGELLPLSFGPGELGK